MTAILQQPPHRHCRDIRTIALTATGSPIPVSGRLTGPETGPTVLVLGGISSGRAVADHDGERGWWRDFVGPGKAVDTERVRVLSFDFLGHEISPFPSCEDQARAILALADTAAIERFAVAGSSYGGMIALHLAALAPRRVERVLAISAAHKASEMAKAWRAIQRDTVELAIRLGDGAAGLDLARRLAMTTYRTPEEFEARFGAPEAGSRDAEGIAAYLAARGADYAATTTPERFLALSRSMDSHEIDPCRIVCPVTYLAAIEDRLVPADQIEAASRATPAGTVRTFHSLYGHDAFLKETDTIAAALQDFTGSLIRRERKGER